MPNIKDIRPKQLAEGITGFYAHGERLTFGYVELKEGSAVPVHQHAQEQITYILEGQLDMMIGGNLYSLLPGMYFVIPSNTPHGAKAITDCIAIDAFNPPRDDYR